MKQQGIYICNKCIIQRDTPELMSMEILAFVFRHGTQVASMNQEHTKHSRYDATNALCVLNGPDREWRMAFCFCSR